MPNCNASTRNTSHWGNPFLRSNYNELDVKLKTKVFDRRITASAFYKDFRDNITGLSNTTNKMSGYGISVKSSFRKALNFQIQHSPYQQGNNNPDTLFRTDNQLAVTTASLIFMKQYKNHSISSIFSFVNSTVDYNQGQMQVDNKLLLWSTTFINEKMNITAMTSRNITGPIVDTLNFWGYRIGINQTSGKKINVSFNGFIDQYDIGAYRSRGILQLRIAASSKLEFALNAEAGKIVKLYGVDDKFVYGSRLLAKFSF